SNFQFKNMKKIVSIILLFVGASAGAQQFVNSGVIEFEVRRNNHKTFGNGIWAEMAKDKFPQFSTSYYLFTFADNKAIYKYSRKDEKNKMPWGNDGEDNIWFSDYSTNTYTDSKFVFDNTYLLHDSLIK